MVPPFLSTRKTVSSHCGTAKQQKSVGRDRAHIAPVSSGVVIRIRARLEGVPKRSLKEEGFSRCHGYPDPQL
jgi:hypothetical protein